MDIEREIEEVCKEKWVKAASRVKS